MVGTFSVWRCSGRPGPPTWTVGQLGHVLVVSDQECLQLGTVVQAAGDGGESVHVQDDLPQVLQICKVGGQIRQSVAAEVQELQQRSKTDKGGDGGDLVVEDVDLVQQLNDPVKI